MLTFLQHVHTHARTRNTRAQVTQSRHPTVGTGDCNDARPDNSPLSVPPPMVQMQLIGNQIRIRGGGKRRGGRAGLGGRVMCGALSQRMTLGGGTHEGQLV